MQKGQAAQIFRIPDPGDGILRAQTLGSQAGQHVHLVPRRGGDHDVRMLHVSFGQDIGADAAALNKQRVQGIHAPLHHGVAGVHHGDVVALLHQPLRQGLAQLPAAHNHNPQGFLLCSSKSVNIFIISHPRPFEKG